MDIVIRTGFQKVSHNINFQPETIPKGKLLVKANHVQNVEEFRKQGNSYQISAQIIRQTSVTSTPYNTKLFLDDARCVSAATCTCVYNQSGKCKHIAALIDYVNNNESLSKTDHEQQWGKPSARQFALEKYSKGKYFYQMFPPKEKPRLKRCNIDVNELQESSALKAMLLESGKDKTKQFVDNLMSDMLSQIEKIIEKEDCENCVDYLLSLANKKMFYKYVVKLTEEDRDFYEENIVLSKPEIINLCYETITQSECVKWFKIRSQRIFASQNAHKIKSRCRKTVESLVMEILHPKNINTLATQYGKDHESEARKEYECIFNSKVVKVGVIVSVFQPWLCASLDGVVLHNKKPCKILEIKCPLKCKTVPIFDIEKKVFNVS